MCCGYACLQEAWRGGRSREIATNINSCTGYLLSTCCVQELSQRPKWQSPEQQSWTLTQVHLTQCLGGSHRSRFCSGWWVTPGCLQPPLLPWCSQTRCSMTLSYKGSHPLLCVDGCIWGLSRIGHGLSIFSAAPTSSVVSANATGMALLKDFCFAFPWMNFFPVIVALISSALWLFWDHRL